MSVTNLTTPTTQNDIVDKVNEVVDNLIENVIDGPNSSVIAGDTANNVASGLYSFATGNSTSATGAGSMAEGQGTRATGTAAHAENAATAYGNYSHAENLAQTAVDALYSHAENSGTAMGSYSHAENNGIAAGDYSHAGGLGTKASYAAQTVLGKYNSVDSDGLSSDAALVIGGGTGTTARKDIFTVGWDGEVSANGTIKGTNITSKGSTTQPVYFDSSGVAQGIDALSISHGGTGATTRQNAKANLGIGNATQDVFVSNYTGAEQHWGINAVVANENNTTYEGKRTGLIVENNGLFCYDSTSGQTVWNMDDLGSLDYYKSIDGSSFSKNFLTINPSVRKDNYKKRAYFYWDSNTRDSFSNRPTAMASASTGIGVREVFYRTDKHILVKVTEMWPVPGRQHFNFYNNGSWSGWREATNPLRVTTPSFSSLPQTFYAAGINANHVVSNNQIILSNPSAQTGDWTITTGTGYITISGSISGSTTAKMDLIIPTGVTASSTAP